MKAPNLHVMDYVIFALTLMTSLGIGIYHSLRGGKGKTPDEYLLGNRQMKLVPVTVSMTVTYVSTVTLLGYPAEIYNFGAQFSLGIFAVGLGGCLACWIFVPLFYPLKITSVNEYLEWRYDSKLVKYIGSFCTVGGALFLTGNVFYGPSIAIQAVSGFPAWGCILVCSTISILYTAMGGIKAVIWTDVFQSVIMFSGLVIVVVWGVMKVEGFGTIISLSDKWERLNFFDFDPDPTKRINFWGVIFGNAFTYMGVYGYLQMGVQRYCSLPTITQAKKSILFALPGNMLLTFLGCLVGFVIFTYYTSIGCDPIKAGYIKSANQVFPYFVADILTVPCLPGIFMACLTATALSTASSTLNSSAANVWEDVLKSHFPKIQESQKANILKLLVVILGTLAAMTAFGIMSIGGTLIQIINTFSSAVGGPGAALFYMGAFVPWVTWQGATAGSICGFAFGIWISLGSFFSKKNWTALPTTTANCSVALATNNTWPTMTTMSQMSDIYTTESYIEETYMSGLEKLYSLSFLWMREAVTLVSIAVALFVSFVTGRRDPSTIEAKFMHPSIRRFFTFLSPPENKVDATNPDLEEEDIDGAVDKSSRNNDVVWVTGL